MSGKANEPTPYGAPPTMVDKDYLEEMRKEVQRIRDMEKYSRPEWGTAESPTNVLRKFREAMEFINEFKKKYPDFEDLKEDILSVLKKYPMLERGPADQALEIAYALAKCKYLKIKLL